VKRGDLAVPTVEMDISKGRGSAPSMVDVMAKYDKWSLVMCRHVWKRVGAIGCLARCLVEVAFNFGNDFVMAKSVQTLPNKLERVIKR